MAAFEIGQRVRTLIHIPSAAWAPEQPDIPAGSLGTVTSIHTDRHTGQVMGHGVMLDPSVDRFAVLMEPDEIESAE